MEFVFIAMLIVFIFVVVAKRKTIFVSQGNYGELRVSHILSQLPEEYLVFNDVYLEIKGRSSQIDHVVISKYGVFVIETKNYSGAVYGGENAEKWAQYLNGERYDFRNPIKQNLSHVWAIKDTLHIAPSSIIPIVVFLNGADLHCNTNSAVLYTGQLLSCILNHKTVAFTADGVERLSQKLSENIVTDPGRKQKHIRSVRQNITERELQVANMICPRCKGELVERQGKYGRFLGCSNYPRCKFTTPL
ncbi:MAG: NERD domain-containing protein [Bacteroidales bacterium]|nr:NERD domain-containing protein [Bacteroidales bacterium]